METNSNSHMQLIAKTSNIYSFLYWNKNQNHIPKQIIFRLFLFWFLWSIIYIEMFSLKKVCCLSVDHVIQSIQSKKSINQSINKNLI